MNVMDKMHSRLAGWAGIAFVVINFATGAAGAGSFPKIDGPVQEIRDYLIDKRGVLLAFGTVGLTVPLFALFIIVLARRVAGSAGDSSRMASGVTLLTAAIGGALILASNLVGTSVVLVKSQIASFGDDTIRLAWTLGTILFIGSIGIFGAMIIAVSLAARWSASLPTWLSTAGIALGVVVLGFGSFGLLSSSLADAAPWGIGLVNLWVLAVCVVLIRGTQMVNSP